MNTTDNSGTGCAYIILAVIAFIAIGMFALSSDLMPNQLLQHRRYCGCNQHNKKHYTDQTGVDSIQVCPGIRQADRLRSPISTEKHIGNCELTIDNSKTISPVHVKLSLSNKSNDSAVRVFYVQKGETFKINKITPGAYCQISKLAIRFISQDGCVFVTTDRNINRDAILQRKIYVIHRAWWQYADAR